MEVATLFTEHRVLNNPPYKFALMPLLEIVVLKFKDFHI